ncbi:APC family permease [Pseudomonas sp. dw_358]|uniref:APC family permease n=1 Tax=Pseudomonas sp. dw_358 TaxID=2720083 RepID=UPI001BD4DEE6
MSTTNDLSKLKAGLTADHVSQAFSPVAGARLDGGALPPVENAPGLEGDMGLFRLMGAVMAFAAPLVTVAGYISIVVLFGGVGAPAIYLAALVLVAIFAAGFTAMSRFLPNPGAYYSFITAGLGRVVGLGSALLAVLTYLVMSACTYTFFGISASTLVAQTLGGPVIEWYWYAIGIWAIVAYCGYLKLEVSSHLLLIAMVVELVVITVFDLAVLINGGPEARSAMPFTWHAMTGGQFGLAMLFAVLCFNGFEATAVFREETKNPERTIPWATGLVVGFIGLFYAGSAWVMITAYGTSNAVSVATNNTVGMFPDAMGKYVGHFGVNLAAVLVITSIFAGLLCMQNIMSRYLYSLGVDGALPKFLSRVHPRNKSPYMGSLVATICVALLEIPFIFDGADPNTLYARQSGVGAYGYLLLMLLTSVAVAFYFVRNPAPVKVSVWRTFVAPVVAAFGLAVVFYLAVTNFETLVGVTGEPAQLMQMAVWAVPIFGMLLALYLRVKKPESYRRIGRQEL